MCSPVVKATLFRTFCSNMYCSQLWRDFKSCSIRKLIVGYNHSFRYIMNYHRNCSASGMFVFNSIPSFMELWRNYIYGFMQRLNNSDNKVVAATVSSCRLSSAMWRRWESILYTKTSCLQYFFLSCYFVSVILTFHVTDTWVCIMYLYLILLYFEYGPSPFSVVGLK